MGVYNFEFCMKDLGLQLLLAASGRLIVDFAHGGKSQYPATRINLRAF
jgi:hypothetical protein